MAELERALTAADGARLTYWIRRGDDADGRLLLLVHGAASNHTRWSEFVEYTALRERWDMLRPDVRGNARSVARGRLDLAVWSRDLVEILAAEGYENAVVVGHSLGAQIAIEMASRYPERARGLVLIDPVFHRALTGRQRTIYRARFLLRLAAWIVRALNALGLRRREIPDRDLRKLDEETREALRGGESKEEIARRYGALGPILSATPVAVYLQQALATFAPLPDLATVRCPVLVMLSAGVTFADARVNRREIERFPRVDVVTIDANHWPLTEKPDEVRRAIDGWVMTTFRE